jgi:hypothetical protein
MKSPAKTAHRGKFRNTISIAEYAQRMGLSTDDVKLQMSRGGLPFVEICGALRIEVTERTLNEHPVAADSSDVRGKGERVTPS